jgi:protoporphyrin/coproporphyrin ferrochelatase
MMNKVLLVVNTGTPDDPGKVAVRKYLSEFLNDHRVIDLPWVVRKILVNLIIVPFRASPSSMLYTKLWTDKGSPLKINLENLVLSLQQKLKDEYTVVGAMRYGNPSMKSALEQIRKCSVKELTVLPLYPHYASSTTGSVHEFINNELNIWKSIPEIRFIDQFFSHPSYIEAFSEKIKKYKPGEFDHVLFSYHSLPVRHINKVHPGKDHESCECIRNFPDHGKCCYKATCYETTRLLVKKLGLRVGSYSTSFQSRLTKNWIGPFTDKILTELLNEGKKRVLVVAPSFVADCLETIIEIEDGYKSNFLQAGGEQLVLVESLNYDDSWVNSVIKIAGL